MALYLDENVDGCSEELGSGFGLPPTFLAARSSGPGVRVGRADIRGLLHIPRRTLMRVVMPLRGRATARN